MIGGMNSSPRVFAVAGGPAPRYTGTAMTLHWLVALLVFCNIYLGIHMVGLHVSPAKLRLYSYHKWVGVTLLALAILRLAWRAGHRPPPDLPMPAWQRVVAHSTHGLMYLLLLLVPLAGWTYSSAAGFPVVYLKLWRLPDLVDKNAALAERLKFSHAALASVLCALVLLHIMGAVKHQWLDRDGLMRRMWPGGS